ncbi:MAG: NPCBM/NEW2 domain-containing protein [Planctomycetes bacterium]|nr:NPCBM/NEW2 domain-containing protein [Planctomycetota bacterium]
MKFGAGLMLLAALLCASAARAEELPRLLPLVGKSVPASLVQLSAEGQGRWQPVSGEPIDRPLAEIVSWGAPAELVHGPVVFLIDGSWISPGLSPPVTKPAQLLRWSKDRLTLQRSELGQLSLPIEMVRGVLIQLPGDRQARDKAINRLIADGQPRDTEGDQVRLENGDQVVGPITAWDDRQLTVKVGEADRAFSLERLQSVVFDPALLARPTPLKSRMLVGLRDGSRVLVSQIERKEQHVLLTPAKGLLNDSQQYWIATAESLVSLQPLDGPAKYLSDMTPEGYRHLPYLSVEWPYERDRNVLGTQLRARRRLYAKGIGMHSTSRLTFKLDGTARTFESEIAIDDAARGGGSCRFRVFVDAAEKFASPEITGGDAPVPVRVELGDGKLLSLIVDFGDRADELDYANWLNARLVP